MAKIQNRAARTRKYEIGPKARVIAFKCHSAVELHAKRLCCTNRVHGLLGDRFVTNEPEDAEAASEAVPYEELEGV
jgi:hypothetical protein